MKKILFLFAVVLTFGYNVSNAQIVRSNSERTITTTTTHERPPSESMWYARFGLNFMKVGGDDVDPFKSNIKSNLGYQIVLGFEKPLGPLFWGMEFGLSSRGYKFNNIGDNQKLLAHNGIFSPFNLGYKYNITGEFAVEAHLGVYVSGDYFGKYKDDHDEFNIYDAENHIFPDAGMQFGFGVWYGKVGVDLLFQKGFVNWREDYKMHTNNFMLRLGLAF